MALSHLIFMRHAKSSWDNPQLDDHARPLDARGRAAADRMARELHARAMAPDLIWTSDARRTRETAERLMRALPGPQSVVRVPEFYGASARQVMHHLSEAAEPEGRLLLLGHNPGWQALVALYGGKARKMPTGAALVLKRQFDSGAVWWRPESWTGCLFLEPKRLEP